MISAEQVRNMEIKLNDNDLAMLSEIEESVMQAVSNMKNVCWLYYTPLPRVVIELRKLGYGVKNESTQRDGTLYKISW